MASWTTPATFVPLEKVTAAKMNQQISGNTQYLYTNKMNATVTQSSPTRELATPYTFTGGKLLHVMITLLNDDSMVCDVTINGYVYIRAGRADEVAAYIPISFTVIPGQVYQVDIVSGIGSVYKWVETVIGA